MRVSTRVEYGMLALADIAMQAADGSSVSAPEIAERQGISHKYLEQILTHLKQASLIRAQKGLRGGYALARPADSIRLSEILNALDTSILEVMTQEETVGTGSLRGAVNTCLWGKMNRAILDFAEKKTLAELMQECRHQLTGEWDMYMI